jgi:glycerol uptake facilitator-like aquaporin
MIPFDTSAITQVWVFILAPLTASILAFLASKYFLNFKK